MRIWIQLIGGLLVWAAHFFALYGIGEFAGASAGPRASVFGLTAAALGLVAWLALRTPKPSAPDDLAAWSLRLGQGALLLSALAIAWQAFPALLS